MRVEIMWGEPQHAFIELPDDYSNYVIEAACREWVERMHPDFDSWDWKKVTDG